MLFCWDLVPYASDATLSFDVYIVGKYFFCHWIHEQTDQTYLISYRGIGYSRIYIRKSRDRSTRMFSCDISS